MHQKHHAHQRHNQPFLKQGVLERVYGAVDQVGAVIHRPDTHALRQAGGNLGNFGFDVVDHFQGVHPIARNDDAGYHFALPVQLGETAPLVRPQLDPRDVADQHGRTVVRLDHQLLDVAHPAQIAAPAHHVLGLRHFHHPPAHIAVGFADHPHDLHQWDAVGAQFHRIYHHLILLHKTADGCHFRHPACLGDLVAQEPILEGAQFGQRLVHADHRILIYPADPSRIRADLRGHATGQLAGGEVEILQHPRTRPVNIRAVLENDIHEGCAEHRETAHYTGFRHRNHRGSQRISDLIFHHLRCLAGIFSVNNHLHVR